MRDRAGALVERQPRGGQAPVSDRAHDQLCGHLLALTGVLRGHPAVGTADQLVATQHDRGHPRLGPVAGLDLDRRGPETEHDAALGSPRTPLGVTPQHLDVVADRLSGGVEILLGDVGQVRRVDHDVDVAQRVHLVEFAQLHRGEGSLQRAASADHEDLFDTPVVQRIERMVGDVGGRQHVRVADQDAGHIEGHVAVADHHRASTGQVRGDLTEVRMGVVPPDEVDGGHAPRQIFTRNAQQAVGLGADRVDHGVVPVGEFTRLDVLAHLDVAEEPEARVGARLVELRADRLDLRMVGGHPGAHQTPRRGQHLQHVDAHVTLGLGRRAEPQQGRRGEIARGSGADDRHMIGAQ